MNIMFLLFQAFTADCNPEPFEEGANETSIICELGNPYSEGSVVSIRDGDGGMNGWKDKRMEG